MSDEIQCPRCREVRLVDKIVDALGIRYFCQVCAHEFRVRKINGS